jgi:4'-phosphopantetheinyl transferase
VGIDVEAVREVTPALARRCLSAAELGWLSAAADASLRAERFLQLWTAKEAYLKAIGTGLGTDPRSVTIDCAAGVPQLVGPDRARWRFRSSTPAEAVRVTVCVERAR